MSLKDFNIDQNTCLFLDRDGVINVMRKNDYVKRVDEFVFIDGVLANFEFLSDVFKKIFVVTNQQGISKGLMTHRDLEAIHDYMATKIFEFGGRIDQIYYCPDLESSGSPNRKPEIGMALQAKSDYPDIELRNSIMVGDSESDMIFAKKAGMLGVLIGDAEPEECLADLKFKNFKEFVQKIKE